MRLCLLIFLIVTLWGVICARDNLTQQTGTHSPLNQHLDEGDGGQRTGEKPRIRKRDAQNCPHVCGDTCCDGWTLWCKTWRCIEPCRFPSCRNGTLCGQCYECLCFHGYCCELATRTTTPPTCVPHRPVANSSSSPPQLTPASSKLPCTPTGATETPKTTSKDQNPSSAQAEGEMKEKRGGKEEGGKGEGGEMRGEKGG